MAAVQDGKPEGGKCFRHSDGVLRDRTQERPRRILFRSTAESNMHSFSVSSSRVHTMLVCQPEKREDNRGRRIAPLTHGHAGLEVEAAGAHGGTRPIAEDSKCML